MGNFKYSDRPHVPIAGVSPSAPRQPGSSELHPLRLPPPKEEKEKINVKQVPAKYLIFSFINTVDSPLTG